MCTPAGLCNYRLRLRYKYGHLCAVCCAFYGDPLHLRWGTVMPLLPLLLRGEQTNDNRQKYRRAGWKGESFFVYEYQGGIGTRDRKAF